MPVGDLHSAKLSVMPAISLCMTRRLFMLLFYVDVSDFWLVCGISVIEPSRSVLVTYLVTFKSYFWKRTSSPETWPYLRSLSETDNKKLLWNKMRQSLKVVETRICDYGLSYYSAWPLVSCDVCLALMEWTWYLLRFYTSLYYWVVNILC